MANIDFQEQAPIDFQEHDTSAPQISSIQGLLTGEVPSPSTYAGSIYRGLITSNPTLDATIQHPIDAVKKLASDFGIGDKNSPYIQEYEKAKQEAADLNQQSYGSHPYLYNGSEFVGQLPADAAAFYVGGGLPGVAGLAAVRAASEGGDTPTEMAKNAALGGSLTYAGGKAAEAVAPYIAKGLGSVGDYISKRLGKVAEEQAVKATGATGAAANKFAPETGRYILDNDIVNFGSSPANIAKNAGNAIDAAYEKAPLSEATNTISKKEILDYLSEQIADLSTDPSNANVVRQLQKYQEDISSPKVPDNISLEAAEQTKKGYANPQNWENPLSGQAPKTVSGAYRDLVEQKANEFNPELGQNYSDAKKAYSILNPVQEAAEKRAATLTQSPIGGFGDIASGFGGYMAGGPKVAAAMAVARRIAAPRIASSMAVGADALSKAGQGISNAISQASPQALNMVSDLAASKIFSPEQLSRISKTPYGNVLKNAAKSGGADAVSTTHYILQQNDPNYQKLLKDEQN